MSGICIPGQTNVTAGAEKRTIRTTSQTVEVPASATGDNSNDGVAIQKRQPSLIYTTNSPNAQAQGLQIFLRSGSNEREGREMKGQKDSHRDSLHSKGQDTQFRSNSNRTRRVRKKFLHTSMANQFFINDLRPTCDAILFDVESEIRVFYG